MKPRCAGALLALPLAMYGHFLPGRPGTTLAFAPQLDLETRAFGYWPSLSPDGKFIAYFGFRGQRGQKLKATALVVQTLATRETYEVLLPARVPPRALIAPPRWTPDGKAVVVIVRDFGQDEFERYRVGLETGTAELLP